ncbi:MAG TPA: hypothetical protein VMN36_10065 [Verrucomicrobiales bacterium]|nr:hypothetical protein [Verrucomicrobiales bacterium]
MEARPPLLPVLAVALSIGVLVAFTIFLGVWDGLELFLETQYRRQGWAGLRATDPALRGLWVIAVAMVLASVGGQWGIAWGARILYLMATGVLLLSFSWILAMRGWAFEPGSSLIAALLGFAAGLIMRGNPSKGREPRNSGR